MHYITQYYKNLSEQLQSKINMLEANLNTIDQIKNSSTNILSPHERSKRSARRDDQVSYLISILSDPQSHPEVDIKAVENVLRDAVGVEPKQRGGASPAELKHVASYMRREDYTGSSRPEEQRLDAAREETFQRYR